MNDMDSPFDLSAPAIPEEPLKAADLDFYTLFRRQGNEGRLFFNQRRAVIFDAEAVGALRRQMIETLGQDLARSILMRFAYAQGYNDAERLKDAFDWDSEVDWLTAGAFLAGLAGIAHFEAEEIRFDYETADFFVQGVWRNSFEAEEHLKHFGLSSSPICWMLTGYASGYATRFFGRTVLAMETGCIGTGGQACRFEIRPVDEWGADAEPYLKALGEVERSGQVEVSEKSLVRSQKQITALETVAEVATIASSVLETRQLLQTVVDLTRERFGLYHTHIYVLNESGDSLELAAGAGQVGRLMVDQGWHISLAQEQSLVARAARTQQGVVVNDVQLDPGYFQNPLLPDTRSELAVPIIAADRLLGVLDVQSEGVNKFSDADVRILTTLAGQVGSAIRNAQLFETVVTAQKEAESRLQETETLQKLSQSLAGTLQLDEIIDIFFQACTRLLGFDFAIFLLVDRYQDRLKAVAGMNVTDELIERTNLPLHSQDIMAEVIRTGRTERLFGWDDRFEVAAFTAERRAAMGLRVVTPITLRQENIGLIEVGFKGNLEPTVQDSQIRLLRIFIDQTALALESAQRYETSQKDARREQILREVSARIRGAADVDTVMRTAAQEVGRALGRQAFMYLGNENDGDKAQSVVEEKDA
jgi:GAF domain-containing protein